MALQRRNCCNSNKSSSDRQPTNTTLDLDEVETINVVRVAVERKGVFVLFFVIMAFLCGGLLCTLIIGIPIK